MKAAIVFVRDMQLLYLGGDSAPFGVWYQHLHSNLVRTALVTHTINVIVRYSPDGRICVSASSDRTLHLWDSTTLEEITVLEHESRVRNIAFSEDSKVLAAAFVTGSRYGVPIWDSGSAVLTQTLTGDGAYAEGMTFLEDGN